MLQMEKRRTRDWVDGLMYLFFICLSYISWYLLFIFAFNLLFTEDLLESMDIVIFGFSPLFALAITVFSIRLLKRHGRPRHTPVILGIYALSTGILLYYSIVYSLLPRI
ncbi:hypothetical protein [Exiguobacterium sp. s193]|uniref:hypothetical protein n=1 Tax=Exiguobacterium sp. s193 TaxID=2751207 RepID=UPI001BE93FA4|nr:hypothetical protein [Exiguobacterium sp. s193]